MKKDKLQRCALTAASSKQLLSAIMKENKINLILKAIAFFLFFLSSSAQAQDGALQGKVIDKIGRGLSGQWVDIFDCTTSNPDYEHGYVSSGSTDTEGFYKINLPSGEYRVAVFFDTNYVEEWYNDQPDSGSANCVPVQAGVTTPLADIELASAVTGSISGTVMNSDGSLALQGVDVYAYDSNMDWFSGKTGADGKYIISGLKTNNYMVYFGAFNTAYISEWYNNHDSPDGYDPVSVSAPDTTQQIDAFLDLGSSISGKITDSLTGNPIQKAWIDVYKPDSKGQPVWRGYAESGADGSYLVKGLPSGEHKIEVFKAYKTEPKEWYKNRSSFSSATPVPVNAGEETSGIDIALGPEPPTDLTQVYKLLLLKKRCTIVNGVLVCR